MSPLSVTLLTSHPSYLTARQPHATAPAETRPGVRRALATATLPEIAFFPVIPHQLRTEIEQIHGIQGSRQCIAT